MSSHEMFSAALRRDADSHTSKQINLQSIHFQQGREIAQTYVNMMKSYARLDVLSGRYERDGDAMLVSGFCRIEEAHFDQPLLTHERKQSFWTAQWHETYTLCTAQSDLFSAFCTSFSEFCKAEQIEAGTLCALIRTKSGKLEQRPFPVETVLPEHLAAIGFPYRIRF
ncbi:MAG: hypothetical protein K5705_02860 [Oscillospiraceae bacterium]|nr:hypothetical protein [Oscillospiraceae bacterium]MCR4759212.1 hypothetical protein [Oscillospiraceae bacterium]